MDVSMHWIRSRFPVMALGLVGNLSLLSMPVFAQRELKDIPVPDPKVEQETFQIDDGWKVELFAGDPAMAKPIHMNWDNQHRLWIASSETYPQIKPGEPSNDKILILIDENRDGKAERTVVFADGLLIPTGVLPGNDGDQASAYVVNSDQLLYLRDTDGDLVADERQVILSGFGTEDTHHLLHSLRWGHDGWIYMNQSIYIHSHIETPWGVQRLNGGGIWRYHPSTKRLEVVVRGFVNPWGVHFDRYGQMFATDGAYGEGINYAFPGSVFVTAVGAKRLMTGLNPGSPKHCGLEILSGSHWPESVRGSMVTNDFRAHRVCRFKVSDDRSGYESVQQPELIKTPHVAFRPIDAKQGLDGALYIADWYNPIIQHGEVDFRDPRRDRTHGRIWRLTHKDQKSVASESITAKDPVGKNLERLKDDADLVRLFAGQALRVGMQRSDEVRQAVSKRIDDAAADSTRGLEQLELAWVMEGLGVFDNRLQKSLIGAEDGRLRAAYTHQIANQIRWVKSEQYGNLDPSQISQWTALGRKLAGDEHPRVRLEAVRLLSELPSSEAADAACTILKKPMDRFLDFALWQTLRDLAPQWLPEFRSGKFRFSNDPGAIAFAMRAVEDPATVDAILNMLDEPVAANDAGGLASKPELAKLVAEFGNGGHHSRLVDKLLHGEKPLALPNESQRGPLLQGILESSLRRKETLGLSEASQKTLIDLAQAALASDKKGDSLDPNAASVVAIRTLGPWRVKDARRWLESVAKDPGSSAVIRQAAIAAVSNFGDDSAKALLQQLGSDENGAVAVSAISAQSDVDLGGAARALIDRMSKDPARAEAFSNLAANLLGRKDGAANLLASIQGKTLDPGAARQLKSSLRKMNAGADLLGAIDAAGKLQENRWQASDSLRDRWLELAKTKGDPVRGEWIYRRAELQCVQCHRIGGVGGLVGPDLTSIGAQAPADYLFEALLNPAAKVKEGYNAKVVKTENDEVLAGIPIRESDDQVVLRLADGKEVAIDKSDITDIKDSRSLMPDGLLDSLSEEEAVDLLRFILEMGRIDGKMLVAEDGSIRNWESLGWTEKALVLFNRTSLDSIVGDQSVFTWQSLPALVSGEAPVRGLATFRPHPGVPNYTFLRTSLNVARAGDLAIDLGQTPKGAVSLWANGKPIPVEGNRVKIAFGEGANWLFVGVNRDLVGEGAVRVKVDTEASTAKIGQ
jgi:putative heme-binding domain-containing protein